MSALGASTARLGVTRAWSRCRTPSSRCPSRSAPPRSPGATAPSPFSLARLALIVVAVAAARTAAMGFNRVVDRRFDAANPRTANRELPRGAVSLGGAVAITVGAALRSSSPPRRCSAAGRSCSSPIALFILLGYSLAKRFTWATHLWLGVCLGGAPAGAWIAVTNGFGWAPLALSLAVACWVAGFDIIYATPGRRLRSRAAASARSPRASASPARS